MKTRMGFVSNSSSASFVITWRSLRDFESKEDALKKLTEWGFNVDAETYLPTTQNLGNNVYRTEFWTHMMNNYSDFGCDAAMMYLLLSMDEDFEITSAKVENDY